MLLQSLINWAKLLGMELGKRPADENNRAKQKADYKVLKAQKKAAEIEANRLRNIENRKAAAEGRPTAGKLKRKVFLDQRGSNKTKKLKTESSAPAAGAAGAAAAVKSEPAASASGGSGGSGGAGAASKKHAAPPASAAAQPKLKKVKAEK